MVAGRFFTVQPEQPLLQFAAMAQETDKQSAARGYEPREAWDPPVSQTFADGLNAGFLQARSIVVLDRTSTRLTVGSPGKLDNDVAVALQFACGLAIDHVVLPADHFAQPLADQSGAQATAAPSMPVVSVDRDPTSVAAADYPGTAHPTALGKSQSLFDRVGAAVSADRKGGLAFGALARLLDAGFLPIEAGREILALADWSPEIDQDGLRIARALVAGCPLDEAIALSPGPVDCFAGLLAACACERDQIDAVVKIAAWSDENDRRQATVARSVVEMAALGAAATLVAFTFAMPAGFAVVAACVFLGLRARHAIAGPQVNDGLRADVLGLVATFAALRLPPMIVIRSAAAHLAKRMPTWGKLPETREDLARALALDPMARTLFLRGDLAEAAQRVAGDYARRDRAVMDHLRWQARAYALGLLSLALIMALSR